ncbi:hypothetical protein CBP05_06690 [Pseudomonas putida]|nr:hypothetical protein CBP05_06690 [Pseudomonas putida]OUS90316.1 hypothetical protein CBP06_03790 [Pseudomonas putida]
MAHVSTCLLGCLVTWLLGYLVTWLLGYLVTWLLGYLVTWLLGYLVTWLLGYLVTWRITQLSNQAILMERIASEFNFQMTIDNRIRISRMRPHNSSLG